MSRLLGTTLGRIYRIYYRTLRVRAVFADGSVIQPCDFPFRDEIFVLSERDALAVAGIMAGRGFTVMVAHGYDGDSAASALEALGCHVVRGSSRRGGARALASLIRTLGATGQPAGLVADGPLGPIGVAKPGMAFCALRTRRPLRVLAAAASRAIVFANAWSQIYVPFPFSRVTLAVDDPVPLPSSESAGAVEQVTEDVTRRLTQARLRALAAPTAQPGPAEMLRQVRS
jgi:lysophospholipid acyltransferase (LPLAT)-like uncharacterized protein